jgi:hypothetical protein
MAPRDHEGMVSLDDVEAICRLKFSYFRLLDTKQFEALGELLTEDATTAFDSGKLAHRGRVAIVEFLRGALGDPGVVTMHHGHHPEVTLTGDATATGMWYLEDRVIVLARDFELHGTGIYHDQYVKRDGQWLMSHTGYDRIFERHIKASSGATLSMRTMFGAR